MPKKVTRIKRAKAKLKGKGKSIALPPIEFIKECVSYDETSSTFLRWNIRPRHHFKTNASFNTWNKLYSVKEAGSIFGKGYRRIAVFYKGLYHVLKNSRVIYKMFNEDEDISDKVIDHIDHNKLNDNISNIQAVSISQNNYNKSCYKNFYPRICKYRKNKYVASIGKRTEGKYSIKFKSKKCDTAAEAYIASWHFMLSDKNFRDTCLRVLPNKEVEGFYIRKALEELKLPMEGIPLTLR